VYKSSLQDSLEITRAGQDAQSTIDEIFHALDAAGIVYCVLREYDEARLAESATEIDLLVSPGHLPLLTEVVAAKGFVELPRWGHEPHYFFVAYDKARGSWLKLDVVTELCYGKPFRQFRIELAENCLNDRRRQGQAYALSPENELITLFLHCLLDKADFQPKHRVRLQALRSAAARDQKINQRIATEIQRYLSPALKWSAIAEAIETQGWQSLLNERGGVVAQFFQRAPIRSAWRTQRTRALRMLRPLLFALRRRGLAIALLAPDGAGKSTLAAHLSRDHYLRARLIYMGTNISASTVGLPTTRWLHERIKNGYGRVTLLPKLILVLLKGVGFVNRLVEQWYRSFMAIYHKLRGRFVVYDRYVYDSWLVPRATVSIKRMKRWLLEAACPEPDLVILLDAPGNLLFERKGEHSPEWLEKQRQGYLRLAERVPQMIIVDAQQEAEALRREVISLIWNCYGRQRCERSSED